MIEFIEHHHTGYALRTRANVNAAEITIALAKDYDTAGEVLTRKCCYGKEYLQIPLTDFRVNVFDRKLLLQAITRGNFRIINIAGNGLYTLEGITQKQVDDYIWNLLSLLATIDKLSNFTIRCGGQTGVDEAAAKFGHQAACKTICCFPKGWMFRDETGNDIRNKYLFLKRFGPDYDLTGLL